MSLSAMQPNTLKERFSLAYINAVVSRAGFELHETKIDIDSIDGFVNSSAGLRPQIGFQAKATSQNFMRDDVIALPLPRKNYEDLRAETVNPRLLIVVVMPEAETEWLQQTEDSLVLRRCGYWMNLRGMPFSENSTSMTVEVPRKQIFDVGQLADLMHRAEQGPVL